MEFRVKVPQPINSGGGYTKSDFDIDIENGTVICPEGYVKVFDSRKIDNTLYSISVNYFTIY